MDGIYINISSKVSAQGDEDMTKMHKEWTDLITEQMDQHYLHGQLGKWGIILSEIRLQNGTGWIFTDDAKTIERGGTPVNLTFLPDGEGGHICLQWYKLVKIGCLLGGGNSTMERKKIFRDWK